VCDVTTPLHPSDDIAATGDRGAAGGIDDAGAEHEALLQRAARRMPVMWRVLKLVAKRLTAECPQVSQIGEGQLRVLHLVREGALQVGDLADRCGVADPTVSKMLRGLEHHGLIERRTDPGNRRMVWVSATADGRTLCDRMDGYFERGLAQVLQGLSSDQLRDLLHTMDHLERLMGAYESDRRSEP
jgi:DNA-binding MarR family transcriptional regulator